MIEITINGELLNWFKRCVRYGLKFSLKLSKNDPTLSTECEETVVMLCQQGLCAVLLR